MPPRQIPIWSQDDIKFADRNYRARSTAQPVTKRLMDAASEDFYPTPGWATRALLEYVKFTGEVWECACGDGAMSVILEESGLKVFSSDLCDRGYGQHGIDFLASERTADNIVTNPPYNLAGEFVVSALKKTKGKIALLLRLAFLEGIERREKIFTVSPPTQVLVFSERITFYPKNAERKGSGTTAYAWFVWDREDDGPSRIDWIRPGFKNACR